MIDLNVALPEAASQAPDPLLSRLFYGRTLSVQDPQYFSYTETIPDQPPSSCKNAVRQMVLVCHLELNKRRPSITPHLTPTSTTWARLSQASHSQVQGFWRSSTFDRQSRISDFHTAVGRSVYICYDRHFPEGCVRWAWRVRRSSSILRHSRGLSAYLWNSSSPRAWPMSIRGSRSTEWRRRARENIFTARRTSSIRRTDVGDAASDKTMSDRSRLRHECAQRRSSTWRSTAIDDPIATRTGHS